MKKTVLITGATSGIGYEFSKIFMENNYDVILLGRNLEKLMELEDFSKKKCVRAYIYKFDLSLSENIDLLYKKIKNLDYSFFGASIPGIELAQINHEILEFRLFMS